ncbi:hypothetical protein BVRB_9g205550 [Beta vulgaris subsp. vulgaris]|nr:hypothetical protein BVRB_9g205550 [Beta vulgaris subsp. vulgaris]
MRSIHDKAKNRGKPKAQNSSPNPKRHLRCSLHQNF